MNAESKSFPSLLGVAVADAMQQIKKSNPDLKIVRNFLNLMQTSSSATYPNFIETYLPYLPFPSLISVPNARKFNGNNGL